MIANRLVAGAGWSPTAVTSITSYPSPASPVAALNTARRVPQKRGRNNHDERIKILTTVHQTGEMRAATDPESLTTSLRAAHVGELQAFLHRLVYEIELVTLFCFTAGFGQ